MAKPIFIIEKPYSGDSEGEIKIYDQLQEKLSDYHLLMTFNESASETTYRMFSDKEIEPIELEKLKEILKLK